MRIKDITKEVKLEEAILMSMMASSNFLAKLRNSINQEYFTSSYDQKVCEWLFDYYDDVLKDIGKVLDIDFSKRIRTLGEIKKVLASTKK